MRSAKFRKIRIQNTRLRAVFTKLWNFWKVICVGEALLPTLPILAEFFRCWTHFYEIPTFCLIFRFLGFFCYNFSRCGFPGDLFTKVKTFLVFSTVWPSCWSKFHPNLWANEIVAFNENIMAACVDFEKSEKHDIKLLNNCIYNGDIDYIWVYI